MAVGHEPPRLAFGGVTLLLALAGLAVGVGHALDVGDTERIGELVLAPTATLTLVAGLLTAVGYLGWRRRDLAA